MVGFQGVRQGLCQPVVCCVFQLNFVRSMGSCVAACKTLRSVQLQNANQSGKPSTRFAMMLAWTVVEALRMIAASVLVEGTWRNVHLTSRMRRGVAAAQCVTESRHARTSVRADQVYAGSTILARAGRALIDVHSTVLLPASVAPARARMVEPA